MPLTRTLIAGVFAVATIATATTAFAQHGHQDRGNRSWDRPPVSSWGSGGRGPIHHPPRWGRPGTPRPGPAIPEPTAALAFGLGLLAVGTATRRRARR